MAQPAGGAPAAVATAQIDPAESRIEDFGADLHVELTLSQAVPWRAFTMDGPRRLVLDFAEVDLERSELAETLRSDHVAGLSMGQFREGWSRLVIGLSGPMRIETAGLVQRGERPGSASAVLKIQLAPVSQKAFEEATGAPESEIFALPAAEVPAATPAKPDTSQLRVAIEDRAGGLRTIHEARISRFVGELSGHLHHAGLDVIAGPVASADVVLSFADGPSQAGAVMGGGWRTMPPGAAAPRAEALAIHLIHALSGDLARGPAYPAPVADFRVLGGRDIPSVRVKLDAGSLGDPGWRRQAGEAVAAALVAWSAASSAEKAGEFR